MKVLFITHNVPRYVGDAAGSFVLRLAVALKPIGIEVDVIAPGAPGLPNADVIEGISITRVRYASDRAMTLAYTGTMAESVRKSWTARFALFGLVRHMRKALRAQLREASRAGKPYDVVHAHWWFPSGLITQLSGAGKGLFPPLVVTMHGSDVRLAQNIAPSHPLMRSVLKRARAVTAVSTWLAQRANAIASDVDIKVAPMPVDSSLFAPSSADDVRSGVLFVGRLNAQKGLTDLLEAIAQTVDTSIELNVVGDGPDESMLRAQSSNLGISHRVHWHGALTQSALVPHYQRARVIAAPSRDEGLGLVAVEAQLCGTPVVAYNSGGLTDVVRPDAGGTLVKPGDIKALASALETLAANNDAARSASKDAGSVAHNAMLGSFSPNTVARHYERLYLGAVAVRSVA